jgi:hypothetical protein
VTYLITLRLDKLLFVLVRHLAAKILGACFFCGNFVLFPYRRTWKGIHETECSLVKLLQSDLVCNGEC